MPFVSFLLHHSFTPRRSGCFVPTTLQLRTFSPDKCFYSQTETKYYAILFVFSTNNQTLRKNQNAILRTSSSLELIVRNGRCIYRNIACVSHSAKSALLCLFLCLITKRKKKTNTIVVFRVSIVIRVETNRFLGFFGW